MPERTTRADWEIHPLPATRIEFVEADLSATPMPATLFEKVRLGFMPEQMEDKWFVFSERVGHAAHVWFHRSWTGFCVFEARFEECDGGFLLVGLRINRDPEQYAETNTAFDRDLFTFLVGSLLLGVEMPPPRRADVSDANWAMESWSLFGRAATEPPRER